MTTQNERGWWRRRKAQTANESPWPAEFLARWNLEQEAVRRRFRREVRPSRRRQARRMPEVES